MDCLIEIPLSNSESVPTYAVSAITQTMINDNNCIIDFNSNIRIASINNINHEIPKDASLLYLMSLFAKEVCTVEPDIRFILPDIITEDRDNINTDLYENIKLSVITSSFSSSRIMSKCYISGIIYPYDDRLIKSRVFNGAIELYGERYIHTSFQFHQSLEYLFPFANLYFYYYHMSVPITTFHNIVHLSEGKNYMIINILRSTGILQRGYINIDDESLVVYIPDKDTNEIVPHVKTYFNYYKYDISFNSMNHDKPITDGTTKYISIKDIIKQNPSLANAFTLFDQNIPSFYHAIAQLIINMNSLNIV